MCQSNSPCETSSKNSENHSYSSEKGPEQPLPYAFPPNLAKLPI